MEKTKACTTIALILMCLSIITIVPLQAVNADTVLDITVTGDNVEIYINGQSLDWIASKISSLRSSITSIKRSITNINNELTKVNVDINVLKNDMSVVVYYLNETMVTLNQTLKTVYEHGQAIAYLLENKHQFENYTLAELELLNEKIIAYNQELLSIVSEMTSLYDDMLVQMELLATEILSNVDARLAGLKNEDTAINANLDVLWHYLSILIGGLIVALVGLAVSLYKLRGIKEL